MFRISTIIWLTLTIVTGTLLFGFGQKTEDTRQAIARLEYQIQNEQQNLDILKAEWSYLNRPSRLRRLAEKHLELESPERLPLIAEDAIDYLAPPPPPPVTADAGQLEMSAEDSGSFALSVPAPESPAEIKINDTPPSDAQKSFDDVLKSVGIEP